MKGHPAILIACVLAWLCLSVGFVNGSENEKWQALFDGKTLEGWVQRGGKAVYDVEDGAIVGTTVQHTPNSFLCTEKMYSDFILELEFKVDPSLNSGVQIRSQSLRSYKNGRVHGYQVEIDPSERAWSGGIYDEARRGWLKDLKDNGAARRAFKNGEWNHFRIEAIGDSIKTWLNGVPAAELVDSMTPAGFIGLQVHSTKSEKPLHVRWRNIRIRDMRCYKPVTAKLDKDKVVVTVNGKLFTCYKFAGSQKYPYFWPVNGPASGKSITTETSQPYPHHHSLFFGCDRVNGGNYWQESNEHGQIVSQGPKIIEASGERVVFTDECFWQQPGKKPIILDSRRVVITSPSEDLRFIDFEITLQPLTNIHILKTNHSLFSARVVPELSVKSGGTLINAEGKTGEKGTWGVASPWCDYSGTRDGVTEGIAILQHPGNRWFPSKWFTRDYGFFSPTRMFWPEGGRTELSKDEVLTLRYRVVVHAGNAKTAGIKKIFEQYEQAANTVPGTKVQTTRGTNK